MEDSRRAFLKAANARKGLEVVVETLNSPQGAELRKIVDLWQNSGPNTAKLFAQNPTLFAESQRAWHPALLPTKSGNQNINVIGNIGAEGVMERLGPTGLRHKAVVLFNSLTINPLWMALGWPCARCGTYYIRKRASQKTYCSRRCGNAATAVARTRERLTKERNEKVDRANTAIQEYQTRKKHTSLEWKPWVAKRTNLSQKFLTRAVNRGHLVPPISAKPAKPKADPSEG